MPLFGGVSVDCAEDVDSVTRAKIRNIVGGVEEELKWHRKALFAIAVIASPNTSQSEKNKVFEIIEQLESLNSKIEEAVSEGRRFKDENFD